MVQISHINTTRHPTYRCRNIDSAEPHRLNSSSQPPYLNCELKRFLAKLAFSAWSRHNTLLVPPCPEWAPDPRRAVRPFPPGLCPTEELREFEWRSVRDTLK